MNPKKRLAVILDIEMTQPERRIFQVGAVAIDIDTGQIEEKYNQYHNPMVKLTPYIKNLCNLTDDKLSRIENATTNESCVFFFNSWLESLRNEKHAVTMLAQWGDGDTKIMEQNTTERIAFNRRTVDVKSAYAIYCLTQGNKAPVGSLQDAVEYLGLPKYTPHCALEDAIATAGVFVNVLTYLRLGVKLEESFDIKRIKTHGKKTR